MGKHVTKVLGESSDDDIHCNVAIGVVHHDGKEWELLEEEVVTQVVSHSKICLKLLNAQIHWDDQFLLLGH